MSGTRPLFSFLFSAAALLFCAIAVAAEEPNGEFTVLGLGGGGGIFVPVVSPNNPRVMFITSDMSGVYRSTDGGQRWTMLSHLQINTAHRCQPAFTKKAMYWVKDGQMIVVSHDEGVTWSAFGKPGGWKEIPEWLAAVEGETPVVLMGNSEGLFVSADGGTTWQKAAEGGVRGLFAIGQEVYAAVNSLQRAAVYDSADGGKTWATIAVPQAEAKPIDALVGGRKAGEAAVTLYAIVAQVGTVVSRDGGANWSVCQNWQGQKQLAMASGQTDIIYACQDGKADCKVWGTHDGGKSWQNLYRPDGPDVNVIRSWMLIHEPWAWDLRVMPHALAVNPHDPDDVMITSWAEYYRSLDGGRIWKQAVDRQIAREPDMYESIGLEVTTNWHYKFDPFDPNRHYICYTDIGFARSIDGGKSWTPAVKGCPWHWSNTYYNIAFDPFRAGRIYAATSYRHDIPHWTHVDANRQPTGVGGIIISDDFGENWRMLNMSMPVLPCTDILIGKDSKPDALTMYAAFYEGGVYKSTDSGRSFISASAGLGNKGNMHVMQLYQHPMSGNLYALITGFRDGKGRFEVPGGLWKSTNGGQSWQSVMGELVLAYPTQFAIGPNDENLIYVTAATIPGHNGDIYKQTDQGGMYQSTDGGKTWNHVLTDQMLAKQNSPSYSHGMMAAIHPDDAKIVYFGSEGHGMWVSTDAGKTFVPFTKFPFKGPQNLTFDPADHKTIYITTFGGGVWKGYYLPVSDR